MSSARRIRSAVRALVARTLRRPADPAAAPRHPGAAGDRASATGTPPRTAHAWSPDPPEGLAPGAVPQQPPAGTPPYV